MKIRFLKPAQSTESRYIGLTDCLILKSTEKRLEKLSGLNLHVGKGDRYIFDVSGHYKIEIVKGKR